MQEDQQRTYESLEMALVDDEALVVLAKECDYSPARDEILVRYNPQTERLIQWLGRSTEFGSTDLEDARQNAVFWTMEAINKFDTEQTSWARRCSFYSFMYRVLVARFKDYSKHLRRKDRRQTTLDPQEGDSSRGHIFRDPRDPASLAEAEEAARRLQAAVGALDEEAQQIWKQLCEGASLREIADYLGISYDAVKRRRRKLIASLKQLLREPLPPGADATPPLTEEADGED